jgi:hypothetical protein
MDHLAGRAAPACHGSMSELYWYSGRGESSPGPASIRVECKVFHRAQYHPHGVVRILCVREYIAALLQVHTRHPVQQVPLQTQCHGRDRLDDGSTRLGHIDIEDLLAADALQA